jgi:hypothetical protein
MASKASWWLPFAALVPLLPAQSVNERAFVGSAIGVAAGRGTVDARPRLWLVLDGLGGQVVHALADGDLPYFAVGPAGRPDLCHGGANTSGFAIVGAAAGDGARPEGNGPEGNGHEGNGPDEVGLVKQALQRCRTVAEFEALLRATEKAGRRVAATFVVIDGSGGAALFEVGARTSTRRDVAGSERSRLTFAPGPRGQRLAKVCAAADAIDDRFVLQQVLRDVEPPAGAERRDGAIDLRDCVHGPQTVAGLVVTGVAAGEDPARTLLWAVLGPPIASVAVPLWPAARLVPRPIAGDPASAVMDASSAVGGGLLLPPAAGDDPSSRHWIAVDRLAAVRRAVVFAEAEVLADTDVRMEKWRGGAPAPPAAALRAFQDAMADRALATLRGLAGERR